MSKILWTEDEMIAAAMEHWDMDCDPREFQVVRSTDSQDRPCLIVRHDPSGRTSDEAGNSGRWHLDRTACP